MKIVFTTLLILILGSMFTIAQTNQVFYSGKGWPEGMWTWPGGFAQDPEQIEGQGFTPGTHVFV